MFKCSWFGGVAFGITVFIALCALGSYQVWLYQVEHAEQRNSASKFHAETAEQFVNTCIRDPETFFSVIDCAIKSTETSIAAQRSKYNLQAQQDMAEWALVIVWLTAVGVFVSIAGLIALYWSLTQTQIAIKDNREIGEAQTVAYPSLESLSFELVTRQGDAYRPLINCLWKNAGNTPAFDFEVSFILTVKSLDRADFVKKYPSNVERGLVRIDPLATENMHATPDDISFSVYVDEMERGTVEIGLQIIGNYRNAFNKRVLINENFRSIVIHCYRNAAGIPASEYNFNIKMARYDPSQA